jgi:tetratricopeptide (TPR) repeat protein
LSAAILIFAVGTCSSANSSDANHTEPNHTGSHYTGPEVCSKCHKDIAAAQISTAMADTWRGASAPSLPANFDQKKVEGPDPAFQYEVRRLAESFEFSVLPPQGAQIGLPVEAIIGGKRHGISFLMRVSQVDGIPLERPALIEGRYAYSPHGSLVLSPGFLNQKPTDFEGALGRVLSVSFEKRCLTCHGQPDTLGAGKHGGVRCESCHGPAGAHVDSMQGPNRLPVRPEALTPVEAMAACAQCHTGLSSVNHADPLPGDLLVSSQVPALRNSECFIQSGERVSCTDCHDPHKDSPKVAEKSVQTCLRCHSFANAQHAAICPVSAASDCVTCHMPSIQSNAFRLTDHWIRVHPEQGVQAGKPSDNLRSLVPPRREYLQIIVVDGRAKAEGARQRLQKGDSFYDVAHDVSIDLTAPGGGFIGAVQLADMDPRLASAAARLGYGETTDILDQGERCILLHRLPRDFKWDASRLFEEAITLRGQGNRKAAIEKDQDALKAYPYFLRALVFMGTTLGEAGQTDRASEILAFAVQSYPEDASAQFDLALTLVGDPAKQIMAFRRAIELDPEMVAAYESLGAALASAGQLSNAIQVFREGLTVDPLSATLYYDLGLALKQQADTASAKQAFSLAAKLDPEIAARIARGQ